MSSKKGKRRPLGQDDKSSAATILSPLVSLIPGVGGALQSIASATLDTRQTRAEQSLAYLWRRLVDLGVLPQSDELTVEELENVSLPPDLVFEMMENASRAETEDQIRRLADVIANGAASQKINRLETKRFLEILRGVSDEAFLILCALHPEFSLNKQFMEQHSAIVLAPRVDEESTLQEMEEAARYADRVAQLRQFGLVDTQVALGGNDPNTDTHQITLAGSNLLILCGKTKYPALRVRAQKDFVEEILACFEALHDSNETLGRPLARSLVSFLGFHPSAEPHFNPYCEELFAKERWRSQRPRESATDIVEQLGRMAPTYKCVLDRFQSAMEHAQPNRDYRSSPIDKANLVDIVQDLEDALHKARINIVDWE